MLGLLIGAVALGGGFMATRDFVRRRLRFVDAVRKPAAPLLAGLAATVVALPIAALPLVTMVFGVKPPPAALEDEQAARPIEANARALGRAWNLMKAKARWSEGVLSRPVPARALGLKPAWIPMSLRLLREAVRKFEGAQL